MKFTRALVALFCCLLTMPAMADPVKQLPLPPMPVRVAAPVSPAMPLMAAPAVVANYDSAKVRITAPYPDAKDYRIFTLDNPKEVKYFGQVRAKAGPVPILDVDINGLAPGRSTRCVIEAVDAPGPFPICNLAARDGTHLYPDGMNEAMCLLYSNMGPTPDGLVSINGQGDPHSWPKVLARTAPFVVTASGKPPSGPWLLFDPFTSATISRMAYDPKGDTADYLMATGVASYDVLLDHADVINSAPMVDHRHLMTILADGGTPKLSPNPVHSGHGAMAVIPRSAYYFGSGTLHVHEEVDTAVTTRRWVGINIMPADDPMTSFYSAEAVNKTNIGLRVEDYGDHVQVTQFAGLTDGGAPINIAVAGNAGQSLHYAPRRTNGRGIDNRTTCDLTLTPRHVKYTEDGVTLVDCDLPRALGFNNAKVAFTAYCYHLDNEMFPDRGFARWSPWETYWRMLWGDERHWDNLGVEILP